ncbi:MAG: hypothetical protein D6785_05755, partial [Planctomycetota bacterium]
IINLKYYNKKKEKLKLVKGSSFMKAVLLAGGIEVSPSPYNQVFPKPMLPVGNKPVLEWAILCLKRGGFRDFHIVVSPVTGQMIETYFHNGQSLGVNLHYYYEEEPLGTAGSIGLVEGLEDTFLVMNGDLVTNLDFSKIVSFHRNKKAFLTLACFSKGIYLDFGYLILNGSQLQDYREKPTLSVSVSTGIYVMEPEVLNYLPPKRCFHIPELVNQLISLNKPVFAYEDQYSWWDIGDRKDYERANEEVDLLEKSLELS